jgi:hypothetical protein
MSQRHHLEMQRGARSDESPGGQQRRNQHRHRRRTAYPRLPPTAIVSTRTAFSVGTPSTGGRRRACRLDRLTDTQKRVTLTHRTRGR